LTIKKMNLIIPIAMLLFRILRFILFIL